MSARETPDPARDYELYRTLLELWSKENPIKTTKLQVLLAVNALLVSALNVSKESADGERWYIYVAGAVFSLIWTFSMGRTCLFQDLWQIRLEDLRARHLHDPRFSVLETRAVMPRARPLIRAFGIVPSKYYLLFAPFGFSLAWLVLILVRLT
jgi:K+ transporter